MRKRATSYRVPSTERALGTGHSTLGTRHLVLGTRYSVLGPIVRVVLAVVLFAVSLGGLTLTSYGDQYVNSGVTWGPTFPQVDHANVNPLGVNLFLEKEVDPAKVEKTLQMAHDAGFKWVRQGFAWNDIEISAKGDFTDTRNGPPVNAWYKYDRIVELCAKYDLEIIARLDSPPVWARRPGDDVETYRKGPPNDYGDYGDFVKAVASRYKGKVKYFQIWNEPNLYGEWGGHEISPKDYTRMLKIAHDAAKQANPDAVIITAALAPTAENSFANLNDVLFLEGMYQEGAAPYFDILSTMLYGLGQPPDTSRTDLKYLSFSRPILLRDVMNKYGDSNKPIWISEYAWISLPPDFKGDPAKNIWGKSVDEQTQGRWLVEGYQRARTEWPWMGVMFVWYLRQPDPIPNEPANYFAIVRDDFSPRPAYTALQQYSKQLPDTRTGDFKTPKDKPIWDALGFPLLYGLLGLIAVSSAALGASSLGRWVSAALNRPRDLYSEVVRETARNGALVVGMALLIGLYYKSNSLPLIVASLAGWGLLAFLKPSTGLAAVAFAIPFFWYPKEIGQQHFPIAETLLMLVFGAVLARHAVAYLLPGLAVRLNIEPQRRGGAEEGTAVMAQQAVPLQPTQPLNDLKQTIPLPILHDSAPEDLVPARWPQRPATAPVATARLNTQQLQTEPATAQNGPVRETALPITQPKTQNLLGTRYSVLTFLAWNREDAFAPPAVALLLVGTFSLLTLADPNFARDSARAYRWDIVEPVLFYFLLTEAVTTRRALLRMADSFVAAAVVVALYGLWQFVGGGGGMVAVEGVNRVVSVYQHPNNLALYLDRVLPFAGCIAIFLPWGAHRWRKTIYALACLPMTATFLLTYSRGAWVAVAVAMLVAIGVWLWSRPSSVLEALSRRKALVAGAAGALVVVLILGATLIVPGLPERVFSPGSGLLRIELWKSSLHMLADHPVFGVGIDQFLNQFQDHYITKELKGEPDTSHPHDIFLDYWLSLGIMGLLVLFWLLWRYFREAVYIVKRASSRLADTADPLTRALALGLLASMTAFLAHGLVDNSYFLMDLAMIFWLSCVLMQVMRKT